MKAFGAFMRKELVEIVRTWRIWVLPGIVLFVALTGPPTARFTPQILEAVMPAGTGAVFKLPDPTYLDSYAQWVKNLTQMVTFALVIMWGGLISAERKSGTAVLVLTKPLSRTAFVIAKVLSAALLLVGVTLAGAVLTWALTLAMFGTAPVAQLVAVTVPWLGYALFLLAVMALMSTLLPSQAGAAGVGFGVLIVMSLLGMWPPMVQLTPVGLMAAPGAVLAGRAIPIGVPMATAVLLAALLVGLATRVFERQEL